MKVLHITAYITGGAGIAVKRLHEALLEKGMDSKILCLFALEENLTPEIYQLHQSRSFSSRVLSKLKLDKNSRLTKGLHGDYEAFTFPFSHYKVHLHPLVSQADIIHLHWISDFVDIPSFFSAVKKPMVWTAHDLNPILGGFHYEQDVYRNPSFSRAEESLKKEKHSAITAAGVHFIGSSQLTVDKIKAYLPEVGCTKIPCILDTVNFIPIDKKIAKNALNINEHVILLGTGADDLGNYRKGYWLLQKAIGKLTEAEKKRVKIISFGASKSNQGDSGNPEHLRFQPIHDKRIHSLVYSAMDYFIIPSTEETFGLTGTEALLCNTPLISSRTGGMIDYITEGKNGFLFDPMDADRLVEKIKLAITAYNEAPITDARSSILEWYKKEAPLEKHITLYENILCGNN
ncbi:glycosyltransferase [Pedobacter sp. MC2016-05]|uniref:glycosyltransferase n=1 Tax=Pedobacter sp. MC2016-05 TaxID=2994474 RepID=UPI0022451D1D|nr:glycosyltransferase [Pedobacter sp. MC2016-05]MCX2473211.1 glycosyltransferase [Pedobacter sp. MC2016-05]